MRKVDFTIALQLKELGFTEATRDFYDSKGQAHSREISQDWNTEYNDEKEYRVSCPFIPQVFDWLRIKHDLNIYFSFGYDEHNPKSNFSWSFGMFDLRSDTEYKSEERFTYYEQIEYYALGRGLKRI